MNREPGPETELYWHYRYLARYVLHGLPWIILAASTPVSKPIQKWSYLVIASLFCFATIDLLITGNMAATIWEPLTAIIAFLYASGVWLFVWSRKPRSVPVEPGSVYLIKRPPKTMLELCGSLLSPRWAGSVFIYSNGMTFGYDRKTLRVGCREVGPIRLRPDQVAVKVDGVTHWDVLSGYSKVAGKPWRWDCHRVCKKILKKV